MALHTLVFLLTICVSTCVLSVTLTTGDVQSGSNAISDATDDFSGIKNTGDICQDCKQLFGLLADLLSSAETEEKMIGGIDALCDHLPGPAGVSGICKEEAEKRLPQAISLVAGVKPSEACGFIGLCASRGQEEQLLAYFVKEALQAAVTSDDGSPASHCSLCVFIIKTVEKMLPKDATEAVLRSLLKTICHVVPPFFRHECEVITGKISKEVVDAILGLATPKNICVLLHECRGQGVAPLGPCALPKYRCRDMSTALRCGAVFSCQRFEWQPLDDNAL